MHVDDGIRCAKIYTRLESGSVVVHQERFLRVKSEFLNVNSQEIGIDLVDQSSQRVCAGVARASIFGSLEARKGIDIVAVVQSQPAVKQ